MLPQVEQELLAQWSAAWTGRRRPARLSFLGMRTGLGDGYAAFLAFAGNDRLPCLAVKIPRHAAAEARLRHEWATLSRLRQTGGEPFRRAIPRPVLWVTVNGRGVSVTSAPPGSPLTGNSLRVPAARSGVLDWLVQFACATRVSRPAAQLRADGTALLRQLQETFPLSPRETTVLSGWVEQLAESGTGGTVDCFAAHGRLGGRNLWRAGERLMVMNWEQFEAVSFPLHDVFRFVLTCILPAERRLPAGEFLRAFRSAFVEADSFRRPAWQFVLDYCRVLDVPAAGLEACLGIFLACTALQEYRLLCTAAERGYLPLMPSADGHGRPSFRQAMKNQRWVRLLRLWIAERPALPFAKRASRLPAKRRLAGTVGLGGRP